MKWVKLAKTKKMTLTLIHKIKSMDEEYTCQIDRKPLSIACLSKCNSIGHTPATTNYNLKLVILLHRSPSFSFLHAENPQNNDS
jgi:hypothetical protein